MATKPDLDLEQFFASAQADGIEKAITQYGQGLDHREQEALRQLSADQLSQYGSVYVKLRDGAGEAAKGDWACGAVC